MVVGREGMLLSGTTVEYVFIYDLQNWTLPVIEKDEAEM